MATKRITITLKLSELLYDIQDKSWHAGRTKQDKVLGSLVQATDDAESLNLLKRFVITATGEVRAALSEWGVLGASSVNNVLIKGGEDVIGLDMPTNYNDGATDGLVGAIHNYIVASALAQWYESTDPQAVAMWTAQAQAELEKAHDCILKRKRPLRRGYVQQESDTEVDVYLWDDDLVWDDDRIWNDG